MSDKELLELAAKATGIKYHAYIDDPICGTGINTGDIDVPLWNPLEDDGDALRLAVKLTLLSSPLFHHHVAIQCLKEPQADPYANVRRAIVMAAADFCREE